MEKPYYAMRRANGDWFAKVIKGEDRIPIFCSKTAALQARAHNPELRLFNPAVLDEQGLQNLASTEGRRPVRFWLVDEDGPGTVHSTGHPLELEQLALLEGAKILPRPKWAIEREGQPEANLLTGLMVRLKSQNVCPPGEGDYRRGLLRDFKIVKGVTVC